MWYECDMSNYCHCLALYKTVLLWVVIHGVKSLKKTFCESTVNKDIVLYCIVLYCIVLYCIVLYCIVLYCIVLYCIVLYCIVICGHKSNLSADLFLLLRFQ